MNHAGEKRTCRAGPHRLDPQLELGGLRGTPWRPSRSTPTPIGSNCCSTGCGRRDRPVRRRATWRTFSVPYRPGELTAVAYDRDGREIGRDTSTSAGTGLRLTSSRRATPLTRRRRRPRLPAHPAHRRRRHRATARRPRGHGGGDAAPAPSSGFGSAQPITEEGFSSNRHSHVLGTSARRGPRRARARRRHGHRDRLRLRAGRRSRCPGRRAHVAVLQRDDEQDERITSASSPARGVSRPGGAGPSSTPTGAADVDHAHRQPGGVRRSPAASPMTTWPVSRGRPLPHCHGDDDHAQQILATVLVDLVDEQTPWPSTGTTATLISTSISTSRPADPLTTRPKARRWRIGSTWSTGVRGSERARRAHLAARDAPIWRRPAPRRLGGV